MSWWFGDDDRTRQGREDAQHRGYMTHDRYDWRDDDRYEYEAAYRRAQREDYDRRMDEERRQEEAARAERRQREQWEDEARRDAYEAEEAERAAAEAAQQEPDPTPCDPCPCATDAGAPCEGQAGGRECPQDGGDAAEVR